MAFQVRKSVYEEEEVAETPSSSLPSSFTLKLSGVTFENRQPTIAHLTSGQALTVKPVSNPYDPNCVEVFTKSGKSVGFVPKERNQEFRRDFKNGYSFKTEVEKVSGGGTYSYGLTVRFTKNPPFVKKVEKSKTESPKPEKKAEKKKEKKVDKSAEEAAFLEGAKEGLETLNNLCDEMGKLDQEIASLSNGKTVDVEIPDPIGKTFSFALNASDESLRDTCVYLLNEANARKSNGGSFSQTNAPILVPPKEPSAHLPWAAFLCGFLGFLFFILFFTLGFAWWAMLLCVILLIATFVIADYYRRRKKDYVSDVAQYQNAVKKAKEDRKADYEKTLSRLISFCKTKIKEASDSRESEIRGLNAKKQELQGKKSGFSNPNLPSSICDLKRDEIAYALDMVTSKKVHSKEELEKSLGITPSNAAYDSENQENEESSQGQSEKQARKAPSFQDLKKGDVVKFGEYPQGANGAKKGIEWIILDEKKGKLLLLSKMILDAKPYNEKKTNVTWEGCSLRKWLNGPFMDEAFSKDEQDCIVKTKLVNAGNPSPVKKNLPSWLQQYDPYPSSVRGGRETNDSLFLLSWEEATQLFPRNPSSQGKIEDIKSDLASYEIKDINEVAMALSGIEAEGTDFAKKQGLDMSSGSAPIWFRSPGNTSQMAVVTMLGDVLYRPGCEANDTTNGVRPAMWVKKGETEKENAPEASQKAESADSRLPSSEFQRDALDTCKALFARRMGKIGMPTETVKDGFFFLEYHLLYGRRELPIMVYVEAHLRVVSGNIVIITKLGFTSRYDKEKWKRNRYTGTQLFNIQADEFLNVIDFQYKGTPSVAAVNGFLYLNPQNFAKSIDMFYADVFDNFAEGNYGYIVEEIN